MTRSGMVDFLRLFRPEYVISAISNSWLVVALSIGLESADRQNEYLMQWPVWFAMGLTMVIATGLCVYGICLNDILDMTHDRAFRPNRPLSTGRIAVPTAITLALVSVLGAIGAATFLGEHSTFMCVFTAGAILFFNVFGKFLPATGIISMALIRAMLMFIAVPKLGYAWPVCLAMGHVMVCSAVAYVMEGRRPRLHGFELAQVVAGSLFWTTLLVMFMGWRGTLVLHAYPKLWVWPFAALVVFGVGATAFLYQHAGNFRTRRQAAHQFLRISTLWLILYDAGWMLGAGQWVMAAVHVFLFLAAFLTMAWLKWRATGLMRSVPYQI